LPTDPAPSGSAPFNLSPPTGKSDLPELPHPGGLPISDDRHAAGGGFSATLARRTIIGVVWAYCGYLGARLLLLVATVLLARLLAPAEFGVVSLALVFVALLETLSHFGLAQALVVQPRRSPDRSSRPRKGGPRDGEVDPADTAFVTTASLGLGTAALIAAVAPSAAIFFRQPALRLILPVLGVTLFIRSLGYTHYALAQCDLDFRSRSIAEVAEVATRGVLSVALALAGAGAWSLVLGQVAGVVAFNAVLWQRVRWRPRLRFSGEQARQLSSFGGAVTGVDLLSAVISNADYVTVGRVLGTSALGVYTLAFKVPEMLIFSLSLVADRVLFSAYAGMETDRLARSVVRSLRYTLLISVGLTVGLVLLAQPLVAVLFGPHWAGAVPSLRILSIYAVSVALTVPAGSAFKACGRADLLLKIAVPWTVIAVGLIVAGAPHGIAAVAGAQAVGAASALSMRTLVAAAAPPLLAGALAAAALIAVAAASLPPVAHLVLGAAAGASAYVAGLLWLGRDSIDEIVGLLRRQPGGPPAP